MHMIRSSWSAPRRPNDGPNHQSKFSNLKRFTHVSPNAMRDSRTKSSQNPSKTFPKRSQNPPKTLPKSSQNPPRTLPEPPFKTERENKSIFFYFFQFLEGPGPPKIEPKSLKIEKNTWKNRCQKTTCFLTQFFLDFSKFWPPKTKPKSKFFCYFFENVDFMKIVLPSRRNCYFSRFEPPKND